MVKRDLTLTNRPLTSTHKIKMVISLPKIWQSENKQTNKNTYPENKIHTAMG